MIRIRKEFFFILLAVSMLLAFSYFEWPPVKSIMGWKARRNTRAIKSIEVNDYEVINHSDGEDSFITVDFHAGKHFWHPQVAIWIEDTVGNYIQTLLVTTSTAKGLFYAGRSVSNFKSFDEAKSTESFDTRRVDALPFWSHKRGVRYPDGLYSPPPEHPLPDGISGATPKGNFYFKSQDLSLSDLESFNIRVEVNVAFDENEFYSEYDFVDDTLYHGGTGLLGQPSLIYGKLIHNSDSTHYYVLDLLGHGHHSGGSDDLFPDLSTITTARYVAERIVVGVDEKWYLKK